MELLTQSIINPDRLTETQLYKRNNEIETHENFLNVGVFSEEHTYYDVEKIRIKTLDISYLDEEG